MLHFQMRIVLVFPWKHNLGQPEAEMGTFLTVKEAPIFLKGALRAVWAVEEAHQTRRRRRSLAPAMAASC